MPDLQKPVNAWTPEEIDAFLRTMEQKHNLQARPLVLDAEGLRELFTWMDACILAGEEQEAMRIFGALKPALDHYRDQGGDPGKLYEFLTEWAVIGVQMQPDARDHFSSLSLYRELEMAAAAAQETGEASWRMARVHLQIANHYRLWLREGGRTESLTEGDRTWLEQIEAGAEAQGTAVLEILQQEEKWDRIVPLKRILARAYLQNRKPNEGISLLKEMLEDLPHTQDYHPSQSGELNIEIGKIFMGFRKPEVARRYFQAAYDLFETLGEDFEPFLWQAEGLIESCDEA